MIRSTGLLEAMSPDELERAYRFCVGHQAPALPEDHDHAALVVLRCLRELRQPLPEQGRATVGGVLRLPYRGFTRLPRPGGVCDRLLRRLRKEPARAGDVAGELKLGYSTVMYLLFWINKYLGFAVVEDPETHEIRVLARALRPEENA